MDSDENAMIFVLGNNGECSVIDTKSRSSAEPIPDRLSVLHSLPFGVPPILKELDEDIRDLITDPQGLIIQDLDRTQRLWPREPDLLSLLHTNVCPCSTTLKMDRDETTGKIISYHEEEITVIGMTAKNSMSLKRMPGPPAEALRGNVTNYAFWPGGMDEPSLDNFILDNDMISDWQNDMQTVPPGFEHGMKFTTDLEHCIVDETRDSINETPGLLSIMDLMMPIEENFDVPSKSVLQISVKPGVQPSPVPHVVVISDAPETSKRKAAEWAEALPANVPVSDFDKLVPSLAHKWPFELDTFQKQAIICLEKQESIFVAAHTSSGKTVVAEYAVALSRKHMTRTIYTSPIKALSNQKFREFKATFEDVGLVTGDIQIKPEASCLIMTTEILRSMLYNGSDVVRELEWVIFDEVHYINDHERGVVWEEVLIMLPQHVNLVLLSATVPNTLQFADWVGRTKKKKIYVISTDRRPVPLEHFLYLSSGSGAASKDGMFCILGPDGKFNSLKYNEAAQAKKNVKDKKQAYGPKGPHSVMNPQQERNLLLGMLHFLQKKDKLPVIVFTLSRRRCDTNCAALTSLDLTTASEKDAIHDFTQKCAQKLKGSDRQLPQVRHLMELLKRGLGVHHSGILPILKEVVEMLFHRGLVKVLFATETFAMGVNMPARTVVFDSITKHDGVIKRNLRPSEYIQMAGRAGRRGLDTTGTVIILCKGVEVHPVHELNEMMLGKPTTLESKFRLTYTMILNLLRVRVQHLKVEDMMKRSFSEVGTERQLDGHRKRYEELLAKSKQIKDVECTNCKIDCQDFYNLAWQYIEASRLTMEAMAGSMRPLSPGRVVTIAFPTQGPTLGVIVATSTANANKEFWSRNMTVLHLWEQCEDTSNKDADETRDPDWLAVLAARNQQLFVPEGSTTHQMVDITMKDIIGVTSKVIKLDALKVIADCRKRQQARFSRDLPNQAVQAAIRELVSLSRADASLDESNQSRGMNVDVYEMWHRSRHLKSLCAETKFSCVACPSFVEHLLLVHQKSNINAKLKLVEHNLSDDRLALLPEYHCRILVLQKLHYLDDSRMVKLKGRVACEMSNHELLLTELILENILTERNAAEIAALLSCTVFQAKTASEAKLTNSLKEGIEQIKAINNKIEIMQKECGMLDAVSDYAELNFGLVNVVYEWAQGVPFSTIMAMTDVQEGIIVRCIQRLDEVLGYLKNASRIVGEPTLYCKADEASRAIKRDIVFAASLYTQ